MDRYLANGYLCEFLTEQKDADGRFFDTKEDGPGKSDLAADGVPEQLRAICAKLEAALQPHLAITETAGPVQNAKRSGKAKKEKAKS